MCRRRVCQVRNVASDDGRMFPGAFKRAFVDLCAYNERRDWEPNATAEHGYDGTALDLLLSAPTSGLSCYGTTEGDCHHRKPDEPRNKYQSITLLEAIEENEFDCCIGGARRDEEKARAKERIMSFRDEFGQWDPKNQRPELWNLYNAKVHKGENIRAFPISNWTEMDVWQYIERENLELPSIYFAHKRDIVKRNGAIVPITDVTPPTPDEKIENMMVRFRTVGDITCTAPVASSADSIEKIIMETASTVITERGETRLDDQVSEASMEQRKKEGYF